MSFATTNESDGRALQDPLRRCADGEISPELALSQLLARARAEHETEAALGAAIWDALESREAFCVDRLVELQRLWNLRRHKVHCPLHSL